MWIAYQVSSDGVWEVDAVTPADFKRMDDDKIKRCFWDKSDARKYAADRNAHLLMRQRSNLRQLESDIQASDASDPVKMATVSPVRPHAD